MSIKPQSNRSKIWEAQTRLKTYTPFAPCINDTVTQNKSTTSTHNVATSKFFNNVRIRVATFRTDETNCQIGPVSILRELSLVGARREGTAVRMPVGYRLSGWVQRSSLRRLCVGFTRVRTRDGGVASHPRHAPCICSPLLPIRASGTTRWDIEYCHPDSRTKGSLPAVIRPR